MTDREHCPDCGRETEFVQFASGGESAVKATAEQVGAGLLELRYCSECKLGIENILTVENRVTVSGQ